MLGFDDEIGASVASGAGLVLGHHDLVEFFAGALADDADAGLWGDCSGHIKNPYARQLRHKDLTAAEFLNPLAHEIGRSRQRDPEASHSIIRDRQRAVGALFDERGNDAAATPQHVSVAAACETRLVATCIAVRL